MTKPKPAAKRVRKPRNLQLPGYSYPNLMIHMNEFVSEPPSICVDVPITNKASDCRRLAAWLLKAAAWLEQRERERER